MVFDPSQDTHATRAIADPSSLAAVKLEQAPAQGGADLPRPVQLLDRRRVSYRGAPRLCENVTPTVVGTPDVRCFVEKPTTKQPVQQQMEADAGLVREGSVLGAVNEWRTWFVVDSITDHD